MNKSNGSSCAFPHTLLDTMNDKIRVLLIESDESCVESVKEVLKNDYRDFLLDCAKTVKEGLEKLEPCAGYDDPMYEVVILDLNFPDENGLSLFNKIHSKCKRLPIIVMSTTEDRATECVRLGAQDYVLRPNHLFILPKSLINSIERFRVEKRYKQLVECTKAAIYEIDFINNKLIYVNDQVCEYTGYSKEELFNINPFSLLSESSQQKFADRLKRLNNGEFIPNTAEFQIITKDGNKRWALITADYTFNEDKLTGARVVAIDITSKRKQRKIIDSIYRTAPVGMGIINYDEGRRTILQVNETLCRMTGYKQEELIGKSARILYPSDSEFDRVGKVKYFHHIFKGNIGTIETEWERKDGEIINVLLSTSPVDIQEPKGCNSFTALDITEKRKMEIEFDDILNKKITQWRNEINSSSKTFALDHIQIGQKNE